MRVSAATMRVIEEECFDVLAGEAADAIEASGEPGVFITYDTFEIGDREHGILFHPTAWSELWNTAT